MTTQEALMFIKRAKKGYTDRNYQKAFDSAIESLEKQIPKTIDRTERPYTCPHCGEPITVVGCVLPDYCHRCGQHFL